MQCLVAITRACWRSDCPQQCSSACRNSLLLHKKAARTVTLKLWHAHRKMLQQRMKHRTSLKPAILTSGMMTLHVLPQGTFPMEISAIARCCINKRLQYITWCNGKTWHHHAGHFGVRRTTALLLHTWRWHGIQADVTTVVSACNKMQSACHLQRKASWAATTADQGLMYRWGVDMAGAFPETSRNHKYMFVAVE
eukprot:GHRQ01026141.1.p1 GENE.GHRQ01026141.1~~GHRQ01026141.1.p1  ORF type:complete len:195 (-),score=24.49 GHRQ01026141.1:266-850(-)